MHLLDKLLTPEATALAARRHLWTSENFPNHRAIRDPETFYRYGLIASPDSNWHPHIGHPDNVRAYEAGLLRQPNPYA